MRIPSSLTIGSQQPRFGCKGKEPGEGLIWVTTNFSDQIDEDYFKQSSPSNEDTIYNQPIFDTAPPPPRKSPEEIRLLEQAYPLQRELKRLKKLCRPRKQTPRDLMKYVTGRRRRSQVEQALSKLQQQLAKFKPDQS